MLLGDLRFLLAAIAFSIVVGLTVNFLRPHRLPLVYQAPEIRAVEGLLATSRVVSEPGLAPRSVALEEASAALDHKDAVFVDAREEVFFRLGHIPGAVNLSRSTFASAYPAFEARVGKGQRIIVYCSEADCHDSTIVAKAVMGLGYKSVEVFQGGWEEWNAAGFPKEP